MDSSPCSPPCPAQLRSEILHQSPESSEPCPHHLRRGLSRFALPCRKRIWRFCRRSLSYVRYQSLAIMWLRSTLSDTWPEQLKHLRQSRFHQESWPVVLRLMRLSLLLCQTVSWYCIRSILDSSLIFDSLDYNHCLPQLRWHDDKLFHSFHDHHNYSK